MRDEIFTQYQASIAHSAHLCLCVSKRSFKSLTAAIMISLIITSPCRKGILPDILLLFRLSQPSPGE